ncbi:hypothetical protein O6H91_04G059900 [Diphasiastrum complanatum]|uniref:Uncharacterized protein n=1 Tax=Diphasiastrum complanatum TaxID=34168 RepID=A0ACC2DXG3_DIPCM|nr:hypothetical protein O6H91_04G059900 [Diphasiastrum complanatum]
MMVLCTKTLSANFLCFQELGSYKNICPCCKMGRGLVMGWIGSKSWYRDFGEPINNKLVFWRKNQLIRHVMVRGSVFFSGHRAVAQLVMIYMGASPYGTDQIHALSSHS